MAKKKEADTKPAKTKPASPKPVKAKSRSRWFDKKSHPLIEEQARRLDAFVAALADGRVDAAEVEAQEARLVNLMKEIEPQLDDELHAKITELLCELTAYDLMHLLHLMQASRPRTTFQG
jgi:hypothetical protein